MFDNKRKIELLEILHDFITVKNLQFGLCGLIWDLRDKGKITLDESRYLTMELNRVSNNYPLGYYFPPAEIEPRKELVKSFIIKIKKLKT